MIELYANNAQATLAGAINNTSTAVLLSPGSGALFPNPSAGQFFRITFVDATTGLLREIVFCTARSGDLCTIQRAQEGTTALNWIAGDIAANLPTAGAMANLTQAQQAQQNTYSYAADTGTANNYISAFSPTVTAISDGSTLQFKAAHANTGASTFTPDGITTHPIVNAQGGALVGGEIPVNSIPSVKWNSTYVAWVLQNATQLIAPNGSSLVGFLQAGTGAVSRTSQDKERERVTVTDFGTSLTTTTPWQSAIDSTTDAQIAVIGVNPGTYTPDLSGLSAGTRTLVWMERGNVAYSIAPPPGNRMFSNYLGDVTRPWFVGNWGVGNSKTSGTATDRPTWRVQRDASHTGGTTGGSVNASALSVQNTVGPNVQNYENAIVAQVTSNLAQTSVSPNVTVFQGTLFKEAASTGGFFGANFVARDETKLGTANSLGNLVGLEVDAVASGPDASTARVTADFVARGYDSSLDGATSQGVGIRSRTANTGVLSSEPVNLLKAIQVTVGTLGTIATGISVDGFAASNAHIEVFGDGTAQGIIKNGCQRNTNTNTIAQYVMTGWNSSNAKTNYGSFECIISSNTAGSENGSLQFKARQSGSLGVEYTVGGGILVGTATGGAKGIGTVNATAVYANGTALTCYPLQQWLTGSIDTDFWDKTQPDNFIPFIQNTETIAAQYAPHISPAYYQVKDGDTGEVIQPPADKEGWMFDRVQKIIDLHKINNPEIEVINQKPEGDEWEWAEIKDGYFTWHGWVTQPTVMVTPVPEEEGWAEVHDESGKLTGWSRVIDTPAPLGDGWEEQHDSDGKITGWLKKGVHQRARDFSQVAADRLDLDKFVDYLRTNSHLPAFPGADKWADTHGGQMAIDDLLQRLWETVEVQAVHIAKLHERLKSLEAK